MLKNIALVAALTGLVSPAFANDQLARAAGVEPGVYTTTELVQIIGMDGENTRWDREQRISLIHQSRANLEGALREVLMSQTTASTRSVE